MEQRFKEAISQTYDQGGIDDFINWFNFGENAEDTIKDGFFDFTVSIFRPPVPQYLISCHDKTCLEIGYGGGRLLYPAAMMFKHAIGIDVHEKSDVVYAFLEEKGVKNVTLHATNGREIPADDNSIDFVYSHIVFIHLAGPDVLQSYLREIARVLVPGGVASLYYGRPFARYARKRRGNILGRLLFAAEPAMETVYSLRNGNGYRLRPDVGANQISIMVTMNQMRQECKAAGLDVLRIQRRINWIQGHIVVQKPL